jgi:hypothetical protein
MEKRPRMEKPASTPKIWYGSVRKELEITRRLLAPNAPFIFGLYLLGLAPRMITGAPSIDRPVILTAKVLLAALATEYIFEICNQTLSPEEDARN